ncbi:PaaI family thioesterase [Amycolatopsis thermoflava]|uniref:PaaI family thioesterase n=1 Tax=Amycolatopsis thermoflava TaxID=84480 RepID=UPI003EBDE5EF
MTVPVTDRDAECHRGVVERRLGVVGCRAGGGGRRAILRMPDYPGQRIVAIAVLADHVMGEAFYLAAPPGRWALTTELAVDVLAPLPWPDREVSAAARILCCDARGGFGTCEVTGGDGAVLATASTRLQYVAARAGAGPLPDAAPPDAALDVRAWADDGTGRAELRHPQHWSNNYGVLHGGVWAGITELAAAAVFARDGRLRTAHLHVRYLRLAEPGGPVRAEARPVHLGRSFGVLEVDGTDGTGQRCVTATVTGRRDGGVTP